MPTIENKIQQIYGFQALVPAYPGASTPLAEEARDSFVNLAPHAKPEVSGRKEAA
jgi:hypothetical protein